MPTYERRDVLIQSLQALAELERPWPCELIVVVDGSQDGSKAAAENLVLPFPARVVYQDNAGAAAARNRGALEATGKYLLFLDDDMMADRRILIEHYTLLEKGASAVVGHIPVHPDSPKSLLTPGVERWARLRLARLRDQDGPVALQDFLTGQLSVRASAFRGAGGFDTDFNRGGSFGGEDTDFLYRLINSGGRLRAAPDAVSYQRYVVTPAAHLRQWRQGGRADALLARKHPQLGRLLVNQHRGNFAAMSLIWTLQALPARLSTAVENRVMSRATSRTPRRLTQWAFTALRDAQYWHGVREAGGITAVDPEDVQVLAYHAIEDVADPVTGRYSVPPDDFEAHIRGLQAAGYTFVSAEQFRAHLAGTPAPARSVLLTFDDGYTSVASFVAPLLDRLNIGAVAFIVTDELGGTNTWDVRNGAQPMPLLDAESIRQLARGQWEVGAHSRTHAHLAELDNTRLSQEVSGSRSDLSNLDVAPPQLFAYPYGEHDRAVRHAARSAGYRAALALADGSDPSNHYAYPRIEVQRGMSAAAVVEALQDAPAGSRSRQLRRELRGLLKAVQPVLTGPRRRTPTG